MAKLGEMATLYNNYCSGNQPVAKMLTIYIEESSDGKGINKEKPIKDFHKTIEDRAYAAKRFIEECNFKCEVVLDVISNDALKRYDAHPERICIVQHERIVHIGGKGPLIYYDIDDIIAWCAERDTRVKFVPPAEDQGEVEEEGAACKS